LLDAANARFVALTIEPEAVASDAFSAKTIA
jgi:hypothetical protein